MSTYDDRQLAAARYIFSNTKLPGFRGVGIRLYGFTLDQSVAILKDFGVISRIHPDRTHAYEVQHDIEAMNVLDASMWNRYRIYVTAIDRQNDFDTLITVYYRPATPTELLTEEP